MSTLHNDSVDSADVDNTPCAEGVAAVVSVAPTIGLACAALRAQGWNSTIAGNRITVNNRVFARFINEAVGVSADVAARWVVYEISDRPTVLVVGAQTYAG